MRERFSETEPGAGWNFMLLLGLMSCLLGVVYLLSRWQHRRASSGSGQPMRLYHAVQHKLGLPLADRWRLWRLARSSRTAHPAALLISARMYDHAVQRYCAGWGWFGSRNRTAGQFRVIRTRLFGAESNV